jgi:VanZ family protein
VTRRWVPPLLWAVFILVLTSIPGSAVPDVGDVPSGTDKLVHGTIYGILGFLTARALREPGARRPWRHYLLALLGIAVLALLDEWHQTFIPGRDMDLFDWVADVVGATIGMSAGVLLRRRERTS